MKKLLTILFSLFIFTTISNAQVTTVENGKWWYTSTWSTGVVPDSTDNVIIKHDINIDCSGMCNNLTIDAGARIHNGTVTVYGNLQNAGTIDSYITSLYIKGNLTNTGKYQTTYTYFTGTLDQTIESSDTLFIDFAHDYNAQSKIILEGVAIFKNTNFLLHESELELKDSLILINSNFDGGKILGNGNVLLGVDGKIGWNAASSFGPAHTELTNLNIEGSIRLYGSGEGIWGLTIGKAL